MRKLKIILGGLAAAFVLVTAVGFLLPGTMHVERSVVIDAPPEEIYPLIANFEDGWSRWNPFTDGNMALTYEGPKEGVGARQVWVQEDGGDGAMTITNADPQRGVEFDLVMMQESFRLEGSLLCEPAEGGTKLTWIDDMEVGSNPYSRYMALIIGASIGNHFEDGLDTIKDIAED
jgi:hypothetical protein